MAPAIVTLIIVSITGNVDVRFRLILGLGAIPAFICWLATRSQAESQEFQSTNVARKKPIVSMYSDKRLWLALLGTGGSWFLYDVCYYGECGTLPFDDDDVIIVLFDQGLRYLPLISWKTSSERKTTSSKSLGM